MRRVLGAVALAVLAVWGAILASVALSARRDAAGPADAIIVLGAAQYNGAPSPVFRARLAHAADLWRRRLAPLVVVTGGVAAGDSLSEAAVGTAWLRRFAGLPVAALVPEPTGRASEPSLRATARRLRSHGARRVILVSDGFHMRRLLILARRFGLSPLPSPAPTSPIRRSRRREIAYLLEESVKVPVAYVFTRSE